MKGVVFTELLKMVEEAHGLDMVDTIIDNSDLPSGGGYTAVGTYDHSEAVALVVSLSKETGAAIPYLLKAFGEYLFGALARGYPAFLERAQDEFDFLEQVETYIHVEVRKLYPDAELPSFECSRSEDGTALNMIYESGRHFEDLCEGLILGSLKHYKSPATISREALADGRELFIISR